MEKEAAMFEKGKALELSEKDWWKELRKLGEEGKLPIELANMLASLISALRNNCACPLADAHLIALAQEYILDGIYVGEGYYDLMVYVPRDPERHRYFFYLARKWSGGELKQLNEL